MNLSGGIHDCLVYFISLIYKNKLYEDQIEKSFFFLNNH